MEFRLWLERRKKTVAAVVLVRDGRALILKRGSTAPWMPGKWNLPGGTEEPGEEPMQTAARECVEEAGIRPIGMKFLKMFINTSFEFYVYVADPGDQEVRLNWESTEHKWISKEEIRQYDLVPHVSEALFMVL